MANLERLAGPDTAPERHVIFIHGLNGDLRETWRSRSPENAGDGGWKSWLAFFGAWKSWLPFFGAKPAPEQASGELWPEWLASDIERTAVWTVGYQAAVSDWTGEAMYLADRAANVYERLLAEQELAAGELIFVGHSFGGLVIKQLLRKASDEAQNNRRAKAGELVERTRKVAFLATPHNGADLAVWLDRLRLLWRPSKTVISLAKNDPGLRDLNQWYRGWAGARDIDHLILVENEATHGVVVVPPDSADPGLSQNATPIDADHISIAKPDSRDNEIYVHVRNFIKRAATIYVSREERAIERLGDGTQAILKLQQTDSAKLEEVLAFVRQSGALQRASEQGVSEAAVRAIVERLGGLGLARDDLVPWLDKWTEEVTRERAIGSNEGEAFERAFEKAKALLDAGRLDEASAPFMAELARRREDEKIRLEENRRQDLRLVEEAIEFDKRAFNGEAAAAKLRIMAEIEGAKTPEDYGKYLFEKAQAFYETGDHKGDNAALLIAIAAYRDALKERIRERVPLDWAAIQMRLGNSLLRLGERESGTARLEEAVAAYRVALTEYTPDKAPRDWAATQTGLGASLLRLGERESGTARLKEAIEAFGYALKVRTRDQFPLEWAETQSNLGYALYLLGSRENRTTQVEQAIEVYQEALKELTRVPLKWASTQIHLGNALWLLGYRENGTARLEEAVKAYHEALKECTQEHDPLTWAQAQSSLGNALVALGQRESGTERLKEAIKAFSYVLKETTRDRVPRQWAFTQQALGNALLALGQRESGTARLEEAVAAYRDAMEERTRDRVPIDWATIYGNQGVALMLIAERKADADRAAQAVEQINEAYTTCLAGGHAPNAVFFEKKLSEARAILGRLRGDA